MRKKVLAALFILYFMFLNDLLGVVILVHGSFAAQSDWHQPNGTFYENLKKSAAILNKKVVPFVWSGAPIESKIRRAATHLAEVISSYPSDEEIILIGHSHGGNVISVATQLLSEQQRKQKITTQAITSIKPLKPQPQPPLIDISDALYSLTPTTRAIRTYLTKNLLRRKLRRNKDYKISKIYLLGTPIDTTRYTVSLQVVKAVYNLYSIGDLIQDVAGAYQKQYPYWPRVTNLQVTIDNTGYLGSQYPTHSQMHHAIIAKWILFIPEQLQSCNIGCFELFDMKKTGHIHFKENNFPTYKQQN